MSHPLVKVFLTTQPNCWELCTCVLLCLVLIAIVVVTAASRCARAESRDCAVGEEVADGAGEQRVDVQVEQMRHTEPQVLLDATLHLLCRLCRALRLPQAECTYEYEVLGENTVLVLVRMRWTHNQSQSTRTS